MKPFQILLIILLPLTVILFNFKLMAFNLDFYQQEYLKLGVYDKFSEEDVNKNTILLIDYLNDRNNNLETDFFNEKEILHLKDVKNLIQTAYLLFYISLILVILLIFYFIYTKNYLLSSSSFIYGGALTILIILILFLSNFNNLFTNFHLTFFKNNLWLLDPTKDNLINLFPLQFFKDIFQRIILNSIYTSIILVGFGGLVKYVRKQH